MVEVRVAVTVAELEEARECWRAANVARGKVPGAERVERVREKLADPEALVLVAVEGGCVVGMVLAEAGRAEDGRGPVEPGLCHVSMVFVRPERWGARVGAALLGALKERAAGRGRAGCSCGPASPMSGRSRCIGAWGSGPAGGGARSSGSGRSFTWCVPVGDTGHARTLLTSRPCL
ncbi:GNAT family N-acetyltransferase [Amycolatopsis sp. NPDC051373]|uniref:GNAT family N-acetyltransferase n=1 Tax=Amycolatopsis sp. NPDC051373 TaxID=3155801 RepID=UPI003450A208